MIEVKVKQLEWEERYPSFWIAYAVFDSYYIIQEFHGMNFPFQVRKSNALYGAIIVGIFKTFEDASKYVQNDFEEKVLQKIEVK